MISRRLPCISSVADRRLLAFGNSLRQIAPGNLPDDGDDFGRFAAQLREQLAHDQTDDEEQDELQRALADPDRGVDLAHGREIVADVDDDAGRTHRRPFGDGVTLEAIDAAPVAGGDEGHHGAQQRLAGGCGDHLVFDLAARQNPPVHGVDGLFLRQSAAEFVVDRLAANDPQFPRLFRNPDLLDEQRTTLGVADHVVLAGLDQHEGVRAVDGAVTDGDRALLRRFEQLLFEMAREPLLRSDEQDDQDALDQKLQLELQPGIAPPPDTPSICQAPLQEP
jgi:hypothetical protein